jgi:hypothetical protein
MIACKQKEMTLADLEKAKWDSLDMGIGHISIDKEKDIALKTDSIQFILAGVSGKTKDDVKISPEALSGEFNILLGDVIKPKIADSKEGYLRINLKEMSLKNLTVLVYLKDNKGDTAYYNFKADSAMLSHIAGIKYVEFTSKEDARKKFLAEDTAAWEHVLTENPLPSSFELTLEKRDWTENELTEMKSSIFGNISGVVDVVYSSWLFKKDNEYYYLRYKRIKK